MIKKGLVGLAVLMAVALCAGTGAYAADTADGWKTEIAPYIWFAGIYGTFAVKDASTHVNESFNDISKYLDFGGMLHVESGKDRFSILFDTAYIKLSDSRSLITMDMTESIIELGGAYQVIGPQSGPGLALDVLAGGRYMYLKGELSGPINPFTGLPFDRAGRQDWIDPFVGARVRWGLTKNLMIVARGDVGGFDISRCSTSSWNAIGTVAYSFTDSFSVGAGYRAYYDHYETGNTVADRFEYNATMKGPFVGVGFKF